MRRSWNTNATTVKVAADPEGGTGPGEAAGTGFRAGKDRLQQELGRPASFEDLALYLLFPFDAASYFKFEARYGKTWLLPPEVWFRQGGFKDGERITFTDENGVPITLRSSPPAGKAVTSSPPWWWTTASRPSASRCRLPLQKQPSQAMFV